MSSAGDSTINYCEEVQDLLKYLNSDDCYNSADDCYNRNFDDILEFTRQKQEALYDDISIQNEMGREPSLAYVNPASCKIITISFVLQLLFATIY